MAKATKSPSDLSGSVGVAQHASAGGKGHNGAALATVFIDETDRSARLAVKQTESMKDRLRKLKPLTTEDHIEFRGTMQAKLDAIKAQAEAAKLSLNDYTKKGGVEGMVAGIVRATVSLWMKLSTAVQAGFTPDYNLPWGEISKAATEYKASTGSSGAAQQQQPKSAIEVKAEEATKLAATVKKGVESVRNVLGIKVGGEVTEQQRSAIPDIVRSTCLYCEVEELDTVIKMLTDMREMKVQAREAAAKATAKASKQSKDTVTGSVGEQVEADKPTASAGNRKSRRAAKAAA